MAMLDSPLVEASAVGCDVVSSHTTLGILLDSELSFAQLLARTLATGWAEFSKLFHAMETAGFPLPVACAQVVVRIHPKILYPAPLLHLAHGAHKRLNCLQYRWARTILCCTSGPHFRWMLALASCGWMDFQIEHAND